MTRKDYVLIANVLKDCRTLGYNYDTLNMICITFAKRLSVEGVSVRSESFDAEKFLRACGYQS